MLKALGDGAATIDVPLKPGDYKLHGVSFSIKPGTVAKVNVQVKDGELVPVGNGRQGTSVKIDPPLDLPGWVTGQGVELRGEGARQKFEADLGGFFDVGFKAKKLSELVSSGDARHSASTPRPAAPQDNAIGALANQMIDLSKVKVDAKVNLKESTLDVGGAKVQVDQSTMFSVKGDGNRLSIAGHVALDGFSLDQGGVNLASRTGGKAELSATMTRGADGYSVDSKLTGVELNVDSLTSSHPSSVVPGKMDKVSLGPTQLHDGEVRLQTKVGLNGLAPTGVQKPTVSMSFKGTGTIKDAQLTVKDAKDSATAQVSGQFDGRVSIAPGNVTFDAKLTGAHVDVRDLQETVQGNQLSIAHAKADGDVRFSNAGGKLSVDGEARNIDILVDDFKGGAGGVKADLGRTSVTGDGSFHVGRDGVHTEGRLKGSATIDAASFAQGQGRQASLGSSTVSGDLTKLSLGKGAAELKLENVSADLDVKKAALDVGQASVSGGGRIKGSGSVVLDANGLSLDGKGQVSMKLSDGKVHSSTVDLALAPGSGAELTINELSLGKVSKVKVGPGSRLDAVLAGGSLKVGDNTVELEAGGRAALQVRNVEVSQGKTDLRGSVTLDAKVKAGSLNLDRSTIAGVKLHPSDVEGRVKVSIDDAHLSDDRLTFQNAQVGLDARIGGYVGVATPGQPGVGSLKDPVAVVSAADIKKTSAAQLAGISSPPPAGAPVEALKLLRDGTVNASVPLQGSIEALGMDVVKFPPGSKLDLALSVKDGKIVANDTRATVSGGVKAVGVELLGVRVDENHRVHADVKVAGQTLSVPIPGVRVPADMEKLGELAAKRSGGKGGAGGGDGPDFVDLSHAQLDISNATFSKGRIGLPGGALELGEGSKLSFHGTPMAGELTGSVAVDGVTIARNDVAMKGGQGRGDLRLNYRREGDKAVVDGALSNLSMSTDAVVRKSETGDYVSLGKGKLSGGAVSLHAEVPLDARGLPKLDGLPAISNASVTVGSFSGDLKGARMTSTGADRGGSVELGPSHLEGAVSFSQAKGLTLKGSLDSLDASLADVNVKQSGKTLNVEHGRLQGRGGTIDIAPGRVAVDAKQLAWDITAQELTAKAGPTALKANQVRVRGEGRFAYDSQKDLRVDGKLHVEGRVNSDTRLNRSVTINRKTGISSN